MADQDVPKAPAEDADESLFRRREKGDEPSPRLVETWSAVLLSVTVILTAWSAFESSKWGGEMSIAFSQASSARIQANRAAGQVSAAQQVDLSVYSLWLQMKAARNEPAAAYVEERFPDRFRVAFDEWVAQGGISDPENAPTSPFALASYAPPGVQEQLDLDRRADVKFQEALRNNQRGDNYTVLTIGFATVLFFAALSGRMRSPRAQWTLLGIGCLGFVLLSGTLLTFPKLV
jgi:hypothetical protein